MRVLAVPQVASLREPRLPHGRQRGRRRRSRANVAAVVDADVAERRRDHRVVRRRVRERAARQLEAKRQRRARRIARAPSSTAVVVVGIDDDQHVAEVLRGRAHAGSGRRCRSPRPARRTADPGFAAALRERIQVDDDEIDRRDAVLRRARRGRRRVRGAPGCRRAPCGCSVLTRPSIISGNPVTSEMPMTGSPAAASALAVPPVDTSSKPRPARAAAKATSPVLSETLRSARMESADFPAQNGPILTMHAPAD